jgi:hypothetical protein
VKFILFEVYYRIFYTIGAMSIIECFSYFVEGHQLEYFYGLLALNYQAIDFDSYGDLRRIELQLLPKRLQQDDCFLLFEDKRGQTENSGYKAFFSKLDLLSDSEKCDLGKQRSDLFVLSRNEGRAWFYLFIIFLSYFYCLEVDKATLNTMLMYTKRIHFCILIISHIYSVFTPGLFKKRTGNNFFILMLFMAIFTTGESAIFILASTFEELKLEQLDSELL